MSALLILTALTGYSQTLEELKQTRTEKQAMLDEKQAEVDALQSEITGLTDQIHLLAGWRTGLSGIVGLNIFEANQWAGNPNPNSSSIGLNVNLTAFANRNEEKWFWNNKLLANKAWQTININDQDGGDLFDNSTADLLNLSSLYGYKLTEKIAISALGEMNTSIEMFLEPGTVDIGVGATWTPISNLTVVVHPFNYRLSFPAMGEVDAQGALGAKIRADYARELLIKGKTIGWSSTLMGFVPYTDETLEVADKDGVTQNAGLEELTWLNTFSFTIWKG
ncbi:MAG TPA: DUF3078 domain-containing protein, partial [Saprospiraceae bacterium]|nr:DUF3078 domain-containing protein [Saprospiraceae bacterium]